MATIKFTLDPGKSPLVTEDQKERLAALDALCDDEINARAVSDPDNPPLTDKELARVRTVGVARKARACTGLSQAEFAKAYHFSLGRLRDLEQGRTQADSAVLAYLRLITRDPKGIRESLMAEGKQVA
jgi:putative transcriptional regulator